MRKLFSILFGLTFFVSCSRNPNSVNNTPSNEGGTVQYKVNGHLVTVTEGYPYTEIALFDKLVDGGGINPTAYIFNAEKETNKNELVFAILSDSLLLGNYTYDSTYLKFRIPATVNYNGQLSVLYYWGDYLNINITSYSKGLISGNFTAKLTPESSSPNHPLLYSARGTTLITEGQFKNIKCIY